ncbi:Membrane protein YdfJ [compost metagenome]
MPSNAPRKPGLGLTARLAARPRLVLSVWLVTMVLAALVLTLRPVEVPDVALHGAPGTPAQQVEEILEKDFGQKLGSTAGLVIEGEIEASTLDAELRAAVSAIHGLREIQPDHHSRVRLFQVRFDPELPLSDAQNLTPAIREAVARISAGRFEAWLTGSTAFQYDAKAQSRHDSRRSEGLSLAVSLVVLVLIFGALSAALIPLLVGASTILLFNALMALLGLPMSPISRVLSSLVGLALAIDYSIFLVGRFREEQRHGASPADALAATLDYPRRTIVTAALVMAASLVPLALPDVSISRVTVMNLLLVIGLSLVTTLALVPAMLTLKPALLDWPRPLARAIGKLDPERYWAPFARHVVRHPIRYLVLSLVIVGSLAVPASRMQLWEPVQAIAPKDSESFIGYQHLQANGWSGELMPVILAVKAPPNATVLDAETVRAVAALTETLSAHPRVAEVTSLTTWRPGFTTENYVAALGMIKRLGPLAPTRELEALVNVRGGSTVTLLAVAPRDLMALDDTRAILEEVRRYSEAHPEVNVLAGGVVARVQDFTHELYRPLPLMIAGVILGVLILLTLALRSVVIPLKAAIINFAPIVGALGVLTLVFQDGWLHAALGTPINGAVTNLVPILVFCLTFGLSMDYEVLIMSRIQEAYRRGMDLEDAIVEGMSRSGSLITGAVLILLGVFATGIVSSSPQTQEVCLGLSAALILDATVVRFLLVPALMRLMGRWNWWNPLSKASLPRPR